MDERMTKVEQQPNKSSPSADPPLATTAAEFSAERKIAVSCNVGQDAAEATTWRIVGARMRGTAHEVDGKPCQDAIGWTTSESGFLLTVADGAGSALAAAVGSETAVARVLQSYEQLALDMQKQSPVSGEEVVRHLLEKARTAIYEVADKHGKAVSHYSTTLALAVAWHGMLHAAQIGDGIVAVDVEGSVEDAAPPLHGEYANEAVFLTSGITLSEVLVSSYDLTDVRGVALSSDGLYMVATEVARARAPFAPFFEDAFTAVRAGAGCAEVEAFLARVDDRTGDDKSLVLAVHPAGHE
jgi:hypothetical protein